MLAHNRRKLPALRRVVTYLPPEEYDWLESAARAQGWSVSRFVAQAVDDAHQSERWMLREMQEERLAAEGVM